jgi:omega-6 fatty acid desaturase (delta-12 desaturase)
MATITQQLQNPGMGGQSLVSVIDNPDEATALNGEEPVSQSEYGTLVDTFGNEFTVPDYTINDIRKAIPAELFERSSTKFLLYVLRDIFSLGVTFYLAKTFVTQEYVSSYAIRVCLWSIYGFVNGLFATGLWILAHECGHQTLSTSKILNDTVGWILHSALLVPYFSWKITHGKHHKATGHMERDMVFVPRTRAEFAKRFKVAFEELADLTEDTPISSLLFIIARQLFGWNVHLLANDTGNDFHHRQGEGRGYHSDGSVKRNGWFKGVNHFNPRSPLFNDADALYIVLSDIGLLITASILYYIGSIWGVKSVLVWYGLPYMWVNHWLGRQFNLLTIPDICTEPLSLVAITYLQHTDTSLPHYNPSTWTFVRGAAATIDRDLGFIGHHIFHGITDTHVLHHYISTIPFYNADKASEAIRPIMGKHYRSSGKESLLGFNKKLYDNFRTCQWVEPSDGSVGEGRDVLFYRNRRGLGVAPIDVRRDGSMEIFTKRG